MEFKITSWQRKAVATILKKKRCALFMGMSLGKTATTLTAIDYLFRRFLVEKVLVVAPLRVANDVWSNEIKKWNHTKYIKYSIVTGTEAERKAALEKDVPFYIINRENVEWLSNNCKTNKFDFIVIDESSSFKSRDAVRFDAIKKFKSNYMVLLSGTPTPNGLMDLWTQIFLLDRGESLGKYITNYRDSYFLYNQYTRQWQLRVDPNVIYNKVEHLLVSMKSEDYLDIPEKIYKNEYVYLPSMKAYDKFKKTKIFEFEETGKKLDACSKLTLSNKLLQYCNGFIYDKTSTAVYIHNAKLEALSELLADDENVMVAYNFKEDLIRLTGKFPHAKTLDKKGDNIKKWNDGKIKLLLVHPKSCGHGLNLQFGGRTLIWYGLTWDLDCYLQMNARLHRTGQTLPVVIKHLILKGGEDENVMRALSTKDLNMEHLLNRFALKNIIDTANNI